MSLRLIRASSETPNVINKDDVQMVRFAYGGYDGVAKGFGKELQFSEDSFGYRLDSGKIVIGGWEMDIDDAGYYIPINIVSSGRSYVTVYAEIDAGNELCSIKSIHSTISYPKIDPGDDLTNIPYGVARLALYNLEFEHNYNSYVSKVFDLIIYLKDHIERVDSDRKALVENLKLGNIVVGNSDKIRNMPVVQHKSGILVNESYSSNLFIQAGHCIWSGRLSLSKYLNQNIGVSLSVNKTYEITLRDNTYGNEYSYKAYKSSQSLLRFHGMISLPGYTEPLYYKILFFTISFSNNSLTVSGLEQVDYPSTSISEANDQLSLIRICEIEEI